MGKNQWHNRQHLGALENSIIGHFLSIMWKSLPAAWSKKHIYKVWLPAECTQVH